MTNTQKLELRRSEIAARLAELAGGDDDLTAEETGEMKALMAESERVELRYQAAVKAAAVAPKPPVGRVAADAVATPLAAPLLPDDRDRAELRSRARLTNWANAALADTAPVGAEAELSAAEGLPNGTIPLAMLETRATTSSGPGAATGSAAADADLPIMWDGILPRVFETAVTQALGITTRTAEVGQTQVPVMTAGSSPAQIGEDVDDATVDDADYELTTFTPKRLTSTMELTGEFALLAPGIEESMRRDMGQAFANSMERQILVGTDSSQSQTRPEIGGITHGLTATTNPSAVTTWQEFATLASASLDGVWANRPQDVVIVAPMEVIRYGLSLWQTTTTDMNGLQVLMANSGGVFGSAHLPDQKDTSGADAKVGDCLAVRANGRQWAQRVMFQGFRIIRDELTKASRGITRLTGVAYWDFDVTRTAAVSLVPVRHTA